MDGGGRRGKAREVGARIRTAGQHRGNVELRPRMAVRLGTSPWQHFYSKSKAREERLLKEPSLQKPCANYQKAQGFCRKKQLAVFSQGLRPEASLSARPKSPGTSGISGQCLATSSGMLAGLGFLQRLALTSRIPQSGPHAKSMVTFFFF